MKARFSQYARRIYGVAKPLTPLAAGLVACGMNANAGPVYNLLDGIGVDMTKGIFVLGAALLGWAGVRYFTDEHHTLSPGRIISSVAGGAFMFAPNSWATWMQGF